jgi:hypothetical protein
LKFHFSIGGYFGDHFEVVLKNVELYFYVTNNSIFKQFKKPTHKVLITGDIDWQNLIKYIDELKWKKKHETLVLDGTQWELIFISENKKLKCFGSNAYPLYFNKFIALLKKITNKHRISNTLPNNFYNLS